MGWEKKGKGWREKEIWTLTLLIFNDRYCMWSFSSVNSVLFIIENLTTLKISVPHHFSLICLFLWWDFYTCFYCNFHISLFLYIILQFFCLHKSGISVSLSGILSVGLCQHVCPYTWWWCVCLLSGGDLSSYSKMDLCLNNSLNSHWLCSHINSRSRMHALVSDC
jgi:hypothetical protein